MLKAMNEFAQQRMLKALIESRPNAIQQPASFEEALSQGHFDDPNLSALLALMTRPRTPAPSGGDASSGGMVVMR